MRQPELVNNEIYHIYNRGVEKRDIFLGRPDKFRFISDLVEFNDEAFVSSYYRQRRRLQPNEIVSRQVRRERKPLVEILAFCLMPNHYHLLLRQKKENGITNFMRKIGVGYAMYFNQKYKRSGTLFQGRFKAALVNKESYFLYLFYYIHFNPLDLFDSLWRENKLKDIDKAIQFLESYRWSSFLDYIGQKNFSSVTQRDFLLSFYQNPSDCKREAINWLKDMNLEQIKEVKLEA